MSVKKYLISIQKQGLPRYDGFFSQSSFNENDFKVYGIVGTNLPTNIYFELGVKNKKIPMTPSELGCTLSHLKALEDFIKSDSEYAYIFEDDVKQKKALILMWTYLFWVKVLLLVSAGLNCIFVVKSKVRLLESYLVNLYLRLIHFSMITFILQWDILLIKKVHKQF